MNITDTDVIEVTAQQQAGNLLGHVAGYIAHRTIAMGLRQGIIAAIADSHGGVTPATLADRLDLDELYLEVWCRGALAAGVLTRDGARYALAQHVGTLLLGADGPGFVGGLFPLMLQPEIFDRFEASLTTGERLWWDDTSPAWIDGVSSTGRPFYTRLVPGGLDQVPGLADRLAAGIRIADTACGAGVGLLKLADQYPNCTIVGIDGDLHSVEEARARVAQHGTETRTEVLHSELESMRLEEPVALVINNISMHECRDIDAVTERVIEMLEPDGWFVISDFPFPDTDELLQSVPGRVMSGVQFFEAQIDDQLLPRAAYDALLDKHGFSDIGHFQLSPVHAVTYGRRP